MEKNSERLKIEEEISKIPNLMDIQKKSYEEFLMFDVPAPDRRKNAGLQEVFSTIFPISDYNGVYKLYFLGYKFDVLKNSVDDCIERGQTFAATLYGTFRLGISETKENSKETIVKGITEQEVRICDVPLMTDRGTFIINGAERVIVSQLHRSPGVSFEEEDEIASRDRTLYVGRMVPYRGTWIEVEYDSNSIVYIKLDRKKKFLVTTILRALGYSKNEDILNQFFESSDFDASSEKCIDKIIGKDVIDKSTGEIIAEAGIPVTEELQKKIVKADLKEITLLSIEEDNPYLDIIKTLKKDGVKTENEALVEIFKKMRVGEPATIPGAKTLFKNLFFDNKRYNLSEVGRYKLNRTLGFDVEEEETKDTMTILTKEDFIKFVKKFFKVNNIRLKVPKYKDTVEDVIDITREVFEDFMKDKYSKKENILKKILKEVDVAKSSDIVKDTIKVMSAANIIDMEKGRIKNEQINNENDIAEEVTRILTQVKSDIDHLGNRRVRSVGELVENQFRIGLSRVEKMIKERMTIIDMKQVTPANLINTKPLEAALREFFGSSQLSQFMDQINPLAELTHKRRISALGPGGLNRERAGFEVRDVHYTHYGRLCPIETPEGQNIGLITSLATYAKVNDYGFIETPYRKVKKGIAIDEINYLTADQSDKYHIGPSEIEIDDKGKITSELILSRHRENFELITPDKLDYIDVSPKQVVSAAASLIPFLEHDDANRALMGSNMQRQAVPLMVTEQAFVGTGMENKAAKDSGRSVMAKTAGTISYVDSEVIVLLKDGMETSTFKEQMDVYYLKKFRRTNQDTTINEKPIVKKGQRVKKGEIIADGSAMKNGEISLGKNVIVAMMPWLGYNYEDAIVVSENVHKNDTFTSVHVEEYELEARDTKLGEEEITRDLPNISEDSLKNLDADGIVRIGARIKPGDILIGKVTPITGSSVTPEEKLLRAIFGNKAENVKDNSLKVPPGIEGVIIGIKEFSRKTRGKKGDKEEERIEKVKKEKDKTIMELESIFKEAVKNIDEMDVSKDKKNTLKINEEAYRDFRRNELEEEYRKLKARKGDDLPPGVIKLVKVLIAKKRKISVGDKLSGRHGNKGVVSRILPVEDMPYLADGTPVDIVLNPLGVPSRMNVGQLLEVNLGMAAKKLAAKIGTEKNTKKSLDEYEIEENSMAVFDDTSGDLKFRTPVFNGMKEKEIKDWLKKADIDQDGKTALFDGRTGETFKNRVTVGVMYVMKLIHMVDDKIHARSIGPYSLITQQPLGGKAQFGGQRFGEMEVWALEAYGAAYTLQEMLTVKSDDVEGRKKLYEAIVRGKNVPSSGTPESFNVLIKELQGLGLNIELLKSKSSKETN